MKYNLSSMQADSLIGKRINSIYKKKGNELEVSHQKIVEVRIDKSISKVDSNQAALREDKMIQYLEIVPNRV